MARNRNAPPVASVSGVPTWLLDDARSDDEVNVGASLTSVTLMATTDVDVSPTVSVPMTFNEYELCSS